MKYIFSCKSVVLFFFILHCHIHADANVKENDKIHAQEFADDGKLGEVEDDTKFGGYDTKLGKDDEKDFEGDEAEDDENAQNAGNEENNFYSFTVQDSEGKDTSLNKFTGKVSLVLNVASECGYTDNHYKGLNKIHNHLSPTGKFTVLAFPCNQFGKQEPGTNKVIQNFVQNRYKVKFPVFGKINVIDNNVPAAWKYLIDESGSTPSWNFFKYLVDVNGNVLNAWGPWTSINEIYSIIQQEVTNAMKNRHTEL